MTPAILEPTSGSTTFDNTPKVSWTPDGAASYEIWVSELGSNPHAVHIQSGITQPSYSVPQYLNYEAHRVWVRSQYSNGQQSAWSAARDFGISGTGRPSSLAATNVAATQATLSWSSVPGAVSYDVWVQQDGSGLVQRPIVSTNSVALSGLSLSTPHTFWVQSISNDGTRSPWSQSQSFVTTGAGGPLSQPVATVASTGIF